MEDTADMEGMAETADMDEGADRIMRFRQLLLPALLIMRLQTENQGKILFDYSAGFGTCTMG